VASDIDPDVVGQNMFELIFNDLEKRKLLLYASHTLRDTLHWGDGEVIVPEEQILEQKIQEAEDKLTLDFEQMKLLSNWFLDATDNGLLLAGEDISILQKMIELLAPYLDEVKKEYDVKLRMLKVQIEDAEKVLNKLEKVVPKTEERVGEQQKEMKDGDITAEGEHKDQKFEEKAKRAKKLKKEMQKAEDIAKTAKKKAKGKKLF
jgi:hypothetical protein